MKTAGLKLRSVLWPPGGKTGSSDCRFAGRRLGLTGPKSALDWVLHTEAGAFDDHGFGMVEEPVQDGRRDGAVVIEDGGPLFEGLVGGQHDGAAFVAVADDLEEEVLDLKAIDFLGPVPVELIERFEDRKTRGLNAPLDGVLEALLVLGVDEPAEVIDVGPGLLGCLRGRFGMLGFERGQVQVQQVLPPGQVQGRGRRSVALPLFEEVGDVFAAIGLEGQRVVQGAGRFVGAVDLAQRNDLLDVARSIEPLFLKLACVEVRLRTQAQAGLKEGLLARAMAMDQEFLEVIRIANVLAAIASAQVGGDEFFVVIEEQLVGIDFEGELLGGVEIGHGVAVGVPHDAAAAVGAGGAYHRAVVRQGGQWPEQGLLLGEALEGLAVGLAMNAHVGHGVHPLAGGGIEGAERGDFQAIEEVFFDVTHAVLDAAFFVALPDLTGDRAKAVMGGKVQEARIKTRFHPRGMFQHAGLEVVDHYFGRRAAEELQGVPMTGEELLPALGEGKLLD
jgi:hypothetical protein